VTATHFGQEFIKGKRGVINCRDNARCVYLVVCNLGGVSVFRLNPLRHVLRTFMVVMAQHTTGKVIASKLSQVLLAVQQLLDQCRAMFRHFISIGQ
jgi:hypothetical protein